MIDAGVPGKVSDRPIVWRTTAGDARDTRMRQRSGEGALVAWCTVPSGYVVCERDRALAPARQEDMAVRTAGPVHRLPSHHSPFLSMPAACASVFARIALEATA
ncbi:hypothetical protein [Actinacidiphila glaucinigra]|uniref:hypothetical protein n=1 Tax=Actinacidiphila glaucinigra TaxID=235986 RepID=UPI00386568A7